MNLEPQVVKSINDHRRAELFHKRLALLPIVIVVVVSLGLLAGQLTLSALGYKRLTSITDDVHESGTGY